MVDFGLILPKRMTKRSMVILVKGANPYLLKTSNVQFMVDIGLMSRTAKMSTKTAKTTGQIMANRRSNTQHILSYEC